MTTSVETSNTRRYVELVTERTVERFLSRFFLRDARIQALCIVTPFIAAMTGHRYSLRDLRAKVESDRIPTYVITREPLDDYQHEAMQAMVGSSWIEIRYNLCLHAKVYVAFAERESDSFALFGSANLTSKSLVSNIELGMIVYGEGLGKTIIHDLYHWASFRLRSLDESKLIQPLGARRR